MSTLELARDNFLKPNGFGGYVIRQSDLSSWARCQLQKYYQDRARANPEAPQGLHLSATTYGSIIHMVLQHLEQWVNEGRETALAEAVAMFEYYWSPAGMATLVDEHGQPLYKIDTWIARQTYGGLLERGRITLRTYYEMQRKADADLLGLEYQFAVPLEIGGRLHTFTGTVDRLEIARWNRKPYLSITDYKTGKQPTYLRHNVQFSGYAWASTLPEFWEGWDGTPEYLGELEHFDAETIGALEAAFSSWGYRLHSGSHGDTPLASRRGRWINLQEIKFADAGWRNERDHARFMLAVDGYVRGCEAGAYTVNLSGEVCTYCPWRKDCGGVGLPDEEAGKP